MEVLHSHATFLKMFEWLVFLIFLMTDIFIYRGGEDGEIFCQVKLWSLNNFILLKEGEEW